VFSAPLGEFSLVALDIMVVFGLDLSGVLLGRQPFRGRVDFRHGFLASSASRRCKTIHRLGDVLYQRLAVFAPCSGQVDTYIGLTLVCVEPLARGRETPQKLWRILHDKVDAADTAEKMEANRGLGRRAEEEPAPLPAPDPLLERRGEPRCGIT